MKILGIDTSANVASAAICEVGENPRVIASGSINTKLTHSQTLMPFIESLLCNSKTELSDIDAFAVSVGPGSFTGLRIGVSAIKGMAYGLNKPCKAVSTLLGLAYNFTVTDCVLCAVMDARCNQVYNALFDIKDEKVSRITEDRALFIPELLEELDEKYSDRRIILAGDGAELVFGKTDSRNILLSPPALRYQSGTGVCFAAEEYEDTEAAALMPSYLRLPQAERERLAREQKEKVKEEEK